MSASASTPAAEEKQELAPVVQCKGVNDLDKVVLREVRGSSAEVYLYGGHVTSWKDEHEMSYFLLAIRLFSSLQKLYVEEYQSAFHSFPTLEIWNNMDLQGIESGPLILIHHHFLCQPPIQLILI